MPSQTTRRGFVTGAASLAAGAAASATFAPAVLSASAMAETVPAPGPQVSPGQTPGAPPAFGTAPGTGPEVTPQTFVEAEKLVQVSMTPAHRAEAAGNWRQSMAALFERRTGPRKLEMTMPPVMVFRAAGQGRPSYEPAVESFSWSGREAGPLPGTDGEIAYAPVWKLSRWIHTRQITSERLTGIYIARIRRYDPQLRAVITLMADAALAQARRLDAELAGGHDRGPLHGIPWGAKDLLDTTDAPTTWGAEFHRNVMARQDAAVVTKLRDAGAVLLAKLSLGALALNDVWFGGQTMNPWLLEEGASGSSAGPGAATAAGLVAFAIGSETQGSIVSPTMRCGLTGLRPTFGRVSRAGAMTLSWSCDKLGPMTRSVEDTMYVLQAISGFDPADDGSVPARLAFDAHASLRGLKLGFFPRWMQESTDVDRTALTVLQKLGLQPVPVQLPDWPYASLNTILFGESAAAFERETLDGEVDQLRMQVPDAWPNTFRQSRFLSAVDLVQAQRMRAMVCAEMARITASVDLLLVPSLRDEMLTISNFTGHPSLTLRAGFVEVDQARSDWAPDPAHPLPRFSPPHRVPYGVTLIGRLFDEGTIARVGLALEETLHVADQHPPAFA